MSMVRWFVVAACLLLVSFRLPASAFAQQEPAIQAEAEVELLAEAVGQDPDSQDSVDRRLQQIEEQVKQLAEEEAKLREAKRVEAELAAEAPELEETLAPEASLEEDDQDQDEEVRESRRQRQRRRHTDRKVSVGDRIRVKKGETASEIVAVGAKVEIDGEVEGNVTVWAGDIVIDGHVGGDIKAFGGDIDLEDDADVLGDVTSFGGDIERHSEASVLGSISEVSVGSSLTPSFGRDKDEESWIRNDDLKDRIRRSRSRVVRWDELFEFAWWCVGLAVIFLLGAFSMLVAPDAMDRMARVVRTDLWKAGLVGLAVAVMALPVFAILCVLLTVTLIGIPLIPVLAFVFALAAFLGVMTSCYALGRMASRSKDESGRYSALGVGFLLVLLPLIVSEAMDFLSFLQPIAILFWVVGWMILFAAGVVGVGSLLLTSFGARNPGSRRSGSGFVPPPPPPRGGYDEPLDAELIDPEDWRESSAQEDSGELNFGFSGNPGQEEDDSPPEELPQVEDSENWNSEEGDSEGEGETDLSSEDKDDRPVS